APAPAQALFNGASAAGRKFVDDVVASLAAGHGADSVEILSALTTGLQIDGGRYAELQQRFYRQHLDLWTNLAGAADGAPAPAPVATPDKTDRRFHAPEWQTLPYFDYLKQAYLINSRWLTELVESTALPAPAKNKLRFFARQLIDAAAPANFAATNPEVIKLANATNGDSLARGLEHLNTDLQKGRISMTDESAFEIGRNIAVTPGSVVYENEVMQLIQYSPSTPQVFARPLVMVPPCINKYYILDLQPANSFVSYAVAQGQTVFMVSWRNVPASMGHLTWDQYLADGVIKAMNVACDICGVAQVNVLGFCVGGTLVGAALAVLEAQGNQAAASVTLLTTMLDFSDPGELAVFIDEAYVSQRERDFAHGGVLRGKELALTFSSLRANDLIWNYVVNNYLKGGKPDAFDLLYWNSDSTNLPGAMFVYYVRNTYLENKLREPGKLTMCGVPVDLSSVKLPAYILATREDHIVPWQTAYQSTQLLGGNSRFVLAASGHIAGVVNPAAKNRRNYWTADAVPANARDWLEGATAQPGSWWPDWMQWLAGFGDGQAAAPAQPGNANYPLLEPAPGRYVRERCD
ncbi:MAG: class I poly(R)-hydroxyalkanoic acid synthase, partial [Burkholderiales bacterium]